MIKSWGSEATPSATLSFKRLLKNGLWKIIFLQTLTRLESYAKHPMMLILSWMMANLEDLLNERVVECDTLNPHDFTIKWLRLRQQQRHTCRNSMKQKKKTAVIAYFCCCLVGTIHASQPRQLLDTCSKKTSKKMCQLLYCKSGHCTRFVLDIYFYMKLGPIKNGLTYIHT